jgi:hypothetical protein
MHNFFNKSLLCVLSWSNVVKDQAVRFLKFMRLVGEDGAWDWTTAALVASLFVLVFKVENPGIGEIAAFFTALLARAHKKYLGVKAQGDVAKQIAAYKSDADKVVKEANAKAEQAMAAFEDVKTRLGLESINPWANR